jgi:hypothetical protein
VQICVALFSTYSSCCFCFLSVYEVLMCKCFPCALHLQRPLWQDKNLVQLRLWLCTPLRNVVESIVWTLHHQQDKKPGSMYVAVQLWIFTCQFHDALLCGRLYNSYG